MKKRWICLFVENEIGVLARISGLFSAKSYNLDSLTVGITEDSTISRMTISLTSDDKTFEQIKKQLSRSVEVIKLVDYTDTPIHMKEILFVKVSSCSDADIAELFRISKVFGVLIMPQNYTPEFKKKIVRLHEKKDALTKALQLNMACLKLLFLHGANNFAKNARPAQNLKPITIT